MLRNIDLVAVGLLLALIAIASEVKDSGAATIAQARITEFTSRHVGPFNMTFDLPKLCVTRD